MLDNIALIFTLFFLEIILSVDNVLVISIFTSKLTEDKREKARIIGLSFALLFRFIFIFAILSMMNIKGNIILSYSIRDIILILGGGFLLYKSSIELYKFIEHKCDIVSIKGKISGFWFAIIQIIILDIVFSVDSVLTAVGLTNVFCIIAIAVIMSFILIMIFAGKIANIILKYPGLRITALFFLVVIGIFILLDGLHYKIPKEYIYVPLAFACINECLKIRFSKKIS